jgi:hypothetical protein
MRTKNAYKLPDHFACISDTHQKRRSFVLEMMGMGGGLPFAQRIRGYTPEDLEIQMQNSEFGWHFRMMKTHLKMI